MNISELSRKLKITVQELKDKLPELGFSIGQKAIKVDDREANRIIHAWHEYQVRRRQEEEYRQAKDRQARLASGEVIAGADVRIPSVVTVRDLAQILSLPVTQVIKELMKNGVMASLNQHVDFDTAAIVASDLGFSATEEKLEEKIDLDNDSKIRNVLNKETNLTARPPVIVVMGHVDHGKTKLLDAIRKTDVVAGEAGGITQHIGAYQIERRGRKITFIDTPGHEAFTAMRSRGARVADIAILVVAANDGVMPQTEEAIKIAESAGIPIVVAINKIDLPEANVEKTKQELMKFNLLPEEWGGKTVCVPISAKQGLHIDELLDQVLLVADIESSKMIANPEGELVGTIIESHVDKGFGPVATVLVQNGTLYKGDMLVVAGNYFGHVRAMYDYNSQEILAAPPATPAQIVGLKVTPKVGDMITVTQEKMKQARSHQFEKRDDFKIHRSTEEKEDDSEKVQLNIILRTDVFGSQEAVMESLEKIDSEGVKLKFVQVGLGNITESDVMQADATGALLLGFNVIPSNQARSLAREKKVEIKTYRIIYELIDNVKARLNELILPELLREELGQLLVVKIFKKENKKMVLGCRVQKGKVEKGSLAAALRDGQFVARGKIVELQVGKEPVADVLQGQECGICFEASPLIEEQDILEIYREREVKKTIK